MKKLTIGLATVALAAGGVALAEQSGGPMGGMTTITRAQMQAHAAQVFERLDANHDGKLDQADREARRAAMFDRIDTDHNGQISKAEFTAMKPMRGGPDQPGGTGAGMAGHDMAGMDGPGMGGRRGGGHGLGRMLLRMADTNHDGVVTRDEFTAAAAQHFDHMDANKDGQVTPEERRAMREQMRQRMQDHMQHGGPMGGHDMGGTGAPPPPAN